MKVLTYIKDLPVKLLNENKNYIDLEGATLYIDDEGNRYSYVCFNNLCKKPFFALILNLSQYDVGGHLIKREKYYVPNCFGERGKSVLERPINVDKECEGMEIEILLAVFSHRIFANDEMRRARSVSFEFPSIDNADPIMPRGNAASFNWPSENPELKEEPAPVPEEEEEPSMDEAPSEEAPKEEPAFVFPSDRPAEEREEAPQASEAPVEEAAKVEEPVSAQVPAPTAQLSAFVAPEARKSQLLLRVILPAIFGVLALIIFFTIFFMVKGVVPPNPYRPGN